MRKILAFIIFTIQSSFAGNMEYKIAAKVNNRIITNNEVEVRGELMKESSGLKMTQQQFREQALKFLIDEQIQIQEAEKFGFLEDKQRVDQMLSGVSERLANMPSSKKEAFLQSLRGQFDAQSRWASIIREKYKNSVIVTEEDIREKFQQMEYQKSQTQYLVSEIFLPFEVEKVFKAQDIVAQLRQGLAFSIVAQQISRSPTAESGGNLGWIVLGQNDPILENAIKSMKAGDTSDPIKTDGGYMIYQLKDVKKPGSMSIEDTLYSFNQVTIPETWSDEGIRIHINALMDATTCSDFQAQASGNPEIKFIKTDSIRAVMLSPVLQDFLRVLKENEKTKPIKTPDGIVIFMLCKKTFKAQELPTKDQIKESLEQKRYSLFAAQYLKEITNASLIEIME